MSNCQIIWYVILPDVSPLLKLCHTFNPHLKNSLCTFGSGQRHNLWGTIRPTQTQLFEKHTIKTFQMQHLDSSLNPLMHRSARKQNKQSVSSACNLILHCNPPSFQSRLIITDYNTALVLMSQITIAQSNRGDFLFLNLNPFVIIASYGSQWRHDITP